ncbi:GLPGLI family protein [Flavobacterium sp. JP2137]|uniref:GLPGLI family protein n=1 Tax=Flavobacterium sp. JP2137 TaxID=3414510 RepID=UPI003D2FF069
MKSILLLLIIAKCCAYAQTNHIAHYKLKFEIDASSVKTNPRLYHVLEEAKKFEDEVELRLIFNAQQAVFERLDQNRNAANNLAFKLCGCDKTVYTNIANNTMTYYNKGSAPLGIADNAYILNAPLYDERWVLHDEQTQINGYRCYKASKTQTDAVGKSSQVTAWYTPEFPYPLGPDKYGGLPGLIVQLQRGMEVFVLSKLEFNKKIDLPLPPTKGTEMRQSDYSKLVREALLKKTDKKRS